MGKGDVFACAPFAIDICKEFTINSCKWFTINICKGFAISRSHTHRSGKIKKTTASARK